MTVVEYTSVSIGAASADLFSNVGGSGNLRIKSLWSHVPDRDLRLALADEVPNAADYTLQVGGLSLEFPADSSGSSSFKWNDVDVDWEDGQLIRVRIVLTTESGARQANTPATGVPTISGTAQVGETLTADTSGISDEDGLDSVSYHYQWIRTDANIADATGSTYTLDDDDEGETIRLKVTFIDDKGNSETLAIVAAADVSKKPQFLVSNLGINVETGIMRPLNAARSGFAQAFTTGAKTGGYALGSVGIHVSHFLDGSTVGDHLRVTINGVASEGEPGDAHCTLTNPSSFPAPGVIAFAAPAGAGSCPQLATETTYFVVIEWVSPSGTGSFALIPQTYPTEETAATEEDPGGAEGWSIADKSHYLTVSSDARTWTAYDETASFKIQAKEGAVTAAKANSPATGLPTISGTPQVGETLTADTSAIDDEDGLTNATFEYQWIAGGSDIDGATGSSYLPTSSAQGQTIQVKVNFTDDADNQESLTSAETLAVAAKPNTAATGLPAIGGTPQVDQTLTADISGIADEDGLNDVTYRYQWAAGGSDISGATGSSHTLTSSEEGQTIQVRVTFTDDAGNAESLTSAATAAVAALPTLTATFPVSPYQSARHNGAGDRPQVIVAFSLPVASFEKTTPSVSLTGATVSSVRRYQEDGLENAWMFFLDPDGNDDIVFRLVTGQPCDSGGICTGDGTTLSAAPEPRVLPGPEGEEDGPEPPPQEEEQEQAGDDQQTPQSPPPAPTSLTATVNADGHIVLSWTAPDDDSITGYQVLRRRPGEGESALLVYVADTQSTATTFTDTGVTAGVKHVYRVKAINAAGLSGWSNYVNPTP